MTEVKPSKSVDLLDLEVAADEGALMEVRSPFTGEVLRLPDGSPFTIKLLGKDSDKFMSLARAQNDRRVQQSLRTRNPAILSKVVDADEVELLVGATMEWNVVLGGKPAENNPKVYREVYKNPKLKWLREQVDEFVGNRGNFSKG